MNSGELCELYAAHHILLDAHEHVRGQHEISTLDAELILMDERARVQQEIADKLYGQGGGPR